MRKKYKNMIDNLNNKIKDLEEKLIKKEEDVNLLKEVISHKEGASYSIKKDSSNYLGYYGASTNLIVYYNNTRNLKFNKTIIKIPSNDCFVEAINVIGNICSILLVKRWGNILDASLISFDVIYNTLTIEPVFKQTTKQEIESLKNALERNSIKEDYEYYEK